MFSVLNKDSCCKDAVYELNIVAGLGILNIDVEVTLINEI